MAASEVSLEQSRAVPGARSRVLIGLFCLFLCHSVHVSLFGYLAQSGPAAERICTGKREQLDPSPFSLPLPHLAGFLKVAQCLGISSSE